MLGGRTNAVVTINDPALGTAGAPDTNYVVKLDGPVGALLPLEDGRGGLGIVPQRAVARMPLEAAIHLVPEEDFRNILGRLRVALSQPISVIKPLESFFFPLAADSVISLPEFGAWAKRIWPINFPARFPSVAGAAPEASRSKNQATKSKPLGTRERGSLLTIIAAFAKAHGIEISERRKAGDAIEQLVKEQIGKKVSSRAIQNYLKNADDLIDRRADDPGDDD